MDAIFIVRRMQKEYQKEEMKLCGLLTWKKHLMRGQQCTFEQTADSDTVLTYRFSLVQLATNQKLEALNKA